MDASNSYGHSQGEQRMSLINRLTGAFGVGALSALGLAGAALAQDARGFRVVLDQQNVHRVSPLPAACLRDGWLTRQ